MKTIRYTTAVLITLVMVMAAYTQSERRSSHQERETRTANTKSTRQVERVRTDQKKAVQPTRQTSRKVQRPEVERKRSTQPARVEQKRNTQPARVEQKRSTQPARVEQKRNTQPARVEQKRNTQPARVERQHSVNQSQVERRKSLEPTRSKRPVSISTTHNPRSTYRNVHTKTKVEHRRTADRNVKIHYHHDTYVHNYHVLYYPVYREIHWNRGMYRDYRRWYPHYKWRYKYGYRIQTISVFDAKFNLGEVAMVYGRVYATWHNRQTDDFLLFFGGDYPYQQFTVVLPGRIARRFSWRPERYFLGEHITVTGLITTFDGIPEVVVKHKRQIGLY